MALAVSATQGTSGSTITSNAASTAASASSSQLDSTGGAAAATGLAVALKNDVSGGLG